MQNAGKEITYLLDLLLGDILESLSNLVDLVGLVAVDEAGPGSLKTGLEGLDGLQSAELGEGNGFLDVLGGDLTGGGLLEGVDDVLAGGTDLVGLAGQGDGEKTGIGVGVVLGGNAELAESLGGLGQKGEAGGPLDSGLAAQKGSENGSLGLVACGAESAGTGEGDHNRVADLGGNALLTTVVLGGDGRQNVVFAGGVDGGGVLEELANPLGDLSGVGATGDKSDVGLGVGTLSELGQGIAGDVLLVGGRLGGGDGGAQTAVESNTVGGIDGNGLRVGVDGLLLVLKELADNLVQFVV